MEMWRLDDREAESGEGEGRVMPRVPLGTAFFENV
jgi:hypothetical protein